MNMTKESELGIFSLNEKRNCQIDEALVKNQKKAMKIGKIAAPDLSSILKDQVDKAKETRSGLFIPEGIMQEFEQTFANYETLFSRIDLIPPNIKQFEAVGVDLSYLAKEYDRMKNEGLEPSLVVNPILLIYSPKEPQEAYPESTWVDFYDKLTKDKTIQNNPLKEREYGKGLWVNNFVKEKADHLFQEELNLVTKNKNIHYITNQEDNLIWVVALIPNTNKPLELGTPHVNYEKPGNPESSMHITISQYLALQASRIQSGLNPIDSDKTNTWLQGTFDDGLRVSIGKWGKSDVVGVSWDYNGYNLSNIGCRLPVWG